MLATMPSKRCPGVPTRLPAALGSAVQTNSLTDARKFHFRVNY
jgi:hypothetical protein